jgi:hypothetical protein
MRTSGELLFEQYLQSHAIGFSYEQSGGTKQPDYRIHTLPEVLCEVEDFGEGEIDKKIARAVGGAYYPFGRLRNKIDCAGNQPREYKGKYPCVIVLYNPGFFVDLSSEMIVAAMYGDITYSVPLLDSGEHGVALDTDATFFHDPKRAKMRRSQNRTVSAIAVLESVKPNWSIVEKAIDNKLQEIHDQGLFGVDGAVEAYRFIQEFKSKHLDIDYHLEVWRLRLIHNVYAFMAVPESVFAGPYDLHLHPTRSP